MAVQKTGGDIDAFCTKCKLVLAHVVIAMDGTRVVRVECKTCRGVHAYRKDPSSTSERRTATKSSSKSSTPKRAAVGANDYERVIKGQDLSRAQRYKAASHYDEGDVLDHVTFGLGMVMRALADSKIEVLFPAGLKVLVHNR